jgi:hypothetical protein
MSHKPLVLFFALAAALPARSAFSADHIPGSVCKVSFNSTGVVNYFDGEVFNNTSTSQFVDCPSRRNSCFPLQVHYVDNNFVTGSNLRCYGYSYLENGTITFSASKFSCSSPGGCFSDSQPNFASSAQNFIDIPATACWQGVTCELSAGATIRFLRRVF